MILTQDSDFIQDYKVDQYTPLKGQPLPIPKGRCKKLQRQYTLNNEEDFKNVLNGFCPDYALLWTDENNAKYWPSNHDFKGNVEKRLKLFYLNRAIRYKIYDMKCRVIQYEIKKVRFHILDDIIFFDQEYIISQ